MSQGDKGEQALTQWAKFGLHGLATVTDLDLATLKIHIVIEGVLRYLLAARLDISEGVLDRFRFADLLELSLGGIGNSHLLGGLRALNKARNALSHRLDDSVYVHGELEKFVHEIGCVAPAEKVAWPTTTAEQLEVLKRAFDKAAFAVIGLAVDSDRRLS